MMTLQEAAASPQLKVLIEGLISFLRQLGYQPGPVSVRNEPGVDGPPYRTLSYERSICIRQASVTRDHGTGMSLTYNEDKNLLGFVCVFSIVSSKGRPSVGSDWWELKDEELCWNFWRCWEDVLTRKKNTQGRLAHSSVSDMNDMIADTANMHLGARVDQPTPIKLYWVPGKNCFDLVPAVPIYQTPWPEAYPTVPSPQYQVVNNNSLTRTILFVEEADLIPRTDKYRRLEKAFIAALTNIMSVKWDTLDNGLSRTIRQDAKARYDTHWAEGVVASQLQLGDGRFASVDATFHAWAAGKVAISIEPSRLDRLQLAIPVRASERGLAEIIKLITRIEEEEDGPPVREKRQKILMELPEDENTEHDDKAVEIDGNQLLEERIAEERGSAEPGDGVIHGGDAQDNRSD
jgi:hypothetical protein